MPGRFTTNDLPGCSNKGGLLLGTDKVDELAGKKGENEVRGLGGKDEILGGNRSDFLYGGDGNDYLLPGKGEDVMYGGDGNDFLDDDISDGQQDKLYCGKGRDNYWCYQERLCGQQLREEDQANNTRRFSLA